MIQFKKTFKGSIPYQKLEGAAYGRDFPIEGTVYYEDGRKATIRFNVRLYVDKAHLDQTVPFEIDKTTVKKSLMASNSSQDTGIRVKHYVINTASVTVEDANGKTYSGTIDEVSGEVRVTLDSTVKGPLTVTVVGGESKGSNAKETVSIDIETKQLAPLSVNDPLTQTSTVIRGKAEPNAQIEIMDANGKVLAKGSVKPDGSFAVPLTRGVLGQSTKVIIRQIADGTQAEKTIVVEKGLPGPPPIP